MNDIKTKPSFPNLLLTVIVLLVSALLFYLGYWQLQRAGEKQALYESYQEKALQDPVNLNKIGEFDRTVDDLEWRKCQITGEYAGSITYLLDNQVEKGVPGYHVYSLFRLQGLEHWVMVNRGWIAGGMYRDQIPEIPTPTGLLTLTGRVYSVQQPLLLGVAKEESLEHDLRRVQALDLENISNELGYDIAAYAVKLDPESISGFSLGNQADPGSGMERHLGYAFQWVALAIILLILYFSHSLRRKQDGNESSI